MARVLSRLGYDAALVDQSVASLGVAERGRGAIRRLPALLDRAFRGEI